MTETRNSSVQDVNQLADEELIALQNKVNAAVAKRTEQSADTAARIKMISLANANRFYLPNKPDAVQQAAKLLWHVNNANYDEITAISNENPGCMFLEVKDLNGKTTTPLKQAIYNLDTYTYGVFYNKIQSNPKMLEEFGKQVEEQQTHVDVSPLLEAYKEYVKFMKGWERVREFNRRDLYPDRNYYTDEKLDAGWKNIAKLQHDLLPMHMVREFCRNNQDFYRPDFNAKNHAAPIGGTVLIAEYVNSIKNSGRTISIDSSEFRSDFGSTLGLMRGNSFCWHFDGWTQETGREALLKQPWAKPEPDYYYSLVAGIASYFRLGVEHDAITFTQLFETRKQDLKILRSGLQMIADRNKIEANNLRP